MSMVKTPTQVGPYETTDCLEQGLSHQIFAARDRGSGRLVVLKLAADAEASTQAQYRQIYQRTSRLRHPHLLAVLDHGTAEDGRPYLVMAHHPGEMLNVEDMPVEPVQVARWGVQLASALATLHAHHYAHRSICPAHIWREAGGQLRLAGYASLAPTPAEPLGDRGPYSAPEALRGNAVDGRSDLYSLGVVLYQMLTGTLPTPGASATTLLELTRQVPRLGERGGLSAGFARVVVRLLGQDPVDRPTSAEDALSALLPYADGMTPPVAVGRFIPPASWNQWMAKREQPGCFAWVGEPGSGTTRCLEEAFIELRQADRTVAYLSVEAGCGPFDFLERLWRWAAVRAPGTLDGLPKPLQGLVTSLWPWTFPDVRPINEPSRLARLLPELLRRLLNAAAKGTTPYILVDDWAYVDSRSRDLLMAHQNEVLSQVHFLLASPTQVSHAHTLLLEPFDQSSTSTWLNSVLGKPASGALSERLWALTGGNPGWLVEALAHAATLEAANDHLPDKVDALLAATWRVLSITQRTILTLLALHGGGCSRTDWTTTEFLLSSEWPLDLDELLTRRIIREREGRLQLALGWWTEWILTHETPVRLARLATEMARAYQEQAQIMGSNPSPGFTHRIARLAMQGNDFELALDAGCVAAEAALRVMDYDSASTWVKAVQNKVAEADSDFPALAFANRATGIQGEILRYTGQLDASIKVFGDLIANGSDPEQQGRWLVSVGKCHQMANRLSAAAEAYTAAIEISRAAGDLRQCARATASLGRCLFMLGDRTGSAEAYQDALNDARLSHHAGVEAEALAFLGNLAVEHPETAAEGLDLLQQALVLREGVQDPFGKNDTRALLGNALLMLGRPDEARLHFEACRVLAEEIGYHYDIAVACANLALCDVEQGFWRSALNNAQISKVAAKHSDHQQFTGPVCWLETLISAQLGDFRAMLAAHIAAESDEAALSNPYLRCFGLVYAGARHLSLGALEAAIGALAVASDSMERAGGGEYAFKVHALLTETYLLKGDRTRALEALAFVEAAGTDIAGAAILAQIARLKALYHDLYGHSAEAVHFWLEARNWARTGTLGFTEIEAELFLHRQRLTGATTATEPDWESLVGLAEQSGAPAWLALVLLAAAEASAPDTEAGAAWLTRGTELLRHYVNGLSPRSAQDDFMAHPLRQHYRHLVTGDVRPLTGPVETA